MQRFKRHVTENGSYRGMIRACREPGKRPNGANAYGKFVYSADGTMCDAARRRNAMFREIGLIPICATDWHLQDKLSYIRNMRRDACRIP